MTQIVFFKLATEGSKNSVKKNKEHMFQFNLKSDLLISHKQDCTLRKITQYQVDAKSTPSYSSDLHSLDYIIDPTEGR